MIYNDSSIRIVLAQRILPFNDAQVNGHSYDVTLGEHFIYEDDTGFPEGVIQRTVFTKEFVLHPGHAVLASTAEYVDLPTDMAAYLSMKSGVARTFLTHAMAGWVYPGFQGNVTLELFNVSRRPITLRAGQRIAQLTFMSAMPALEMHPSTLPSTKGTVPAP